MKLTFIYNVLLIFYAAAGQQICSSSTCRDADFISEMSLLQTQIRIQAPEDAPDGWTIAVDPKIDKTSNIKTISNASQGQTAMKVYESNVGFSACPSSHILHVGGGFTNEQSVQDKCHELHCAFYVWSNDDQEAKGSAWFCKSDQYYNIANNGLWSKWRVGRRIDEKVPAASLTSLTTNETNDTNTNVPALEANCTTYDCPFGYRHINDASISLSEEICCLATCESYNCPTGYNSVRQTSTSVSKSNCCQATCEAFNCPIGHVNTNLESTSLSQTTCCSAVCSDGIQNGGLCCPASCGTCGGDGCSDRTGGDLCCDNGVCQIATSVGCNIQEEEFCAAGLLNEEVCCPASCGQCDDDSGCSDRPGGDLCCTTKIKELYGICQNFSSVGCMMHEEVIVISTDAVLASSSEFMKIEETNATMPVACAAGVRNGIVCCPASSPQCSGSGTCQISSSVRCNIQEEEFCGAGIRNGQVCCPLSCGQCGGDRCSDRPGGDLCCPTKIKELHGVCQSFSSVGCIIQEVKITTIQATCETYDCPTGYKRRNLESRSLSDANCCEATCESYDCPAGYTHMNLASTTLTEARCCQATCATFNCPTGYVKVNFASTSLSKSSCCTAVCAAGIRNGDVCCPASSEQCSGSGICQTSSSVGCNIEEEEFCAVGIRNRQVCCPASCGTCGGSDCGDRPDGDLCCPDKIKELYGICHNFTSVGCIIHEEVKITTTNLAKMTTTGPAVCAEGLRNGRVCCPLSCGQCGGRGCRDRPGGALCCASLTNNRICQTSSSTGCKIEEEEYCATGIRNGGVCCPASCGQCGGSGCGDRPGGDLCCPSKIKELYGMCRNFSSVGCNIQEEVKHTTTGAASCATYECGSGYKNFNMALKFVSHSRCCQPTCATYRCGKGFNNVNLRSTTLSQSNCCQPTCESFTCPEGYANVNLASTTLSQAECCQVPCAVGDDVSAYWEGDQMRYFAKIVSIDDDKITVDWDDGETRFRQMSISDVFKSDLRAPQSWFSCADLLLENAVEFVRTSGRLYANAHLGIAPADVMQDNQQSDCNGELLEWLHSTFGDHAPLNMVDVGAGEGGIGRPPPSVARSMEYTCFDMDAAKGCHPFDGSVVPHVPDANVVLFSYVLHRTVTGDSTIPLLKSAAKVTTDYVVIQEELRATSRAGGIGSFAPGYGGVYRGDTEWRDLFRLLGLKVVHAAKVCADNNRRMYVLKKRAPQAIEERIADKQHEKGFPGSVPAFVAQRLHQADCNHELLGWFQSTLGDRAHLNVVDVGGGDGSVGVAIRSVSKNLNYICYDVVASAACLSYEGLVVPRVSDATVVLFNYVLHHAGDNTISLLQSASKVAKEYIVVQEDFKATTRAEAERNLRDDSGGVFRGDTEWRELFRLLGLEIVHSAKICLDRHDIGRGMYVLKKTTPHA